MRVAVLLLPVVVALSGCAAYDGWTAAQWVHDGSQFRTGTVSASLGR